jgi:hypothetical protein
MVFIYVSKIQEKAPMDNKKLYKRGKETYTDIPTLICISQKIKGKKNHQRERSRKEY